MDPWIDGINGGFELFSAVLVMLDVRQLLRDRTIKGVYWPARLGFLLWGAWNLVFYPYFGHWWSAGCGLLLFLANGAWFILAIRYKTRRKYVIVVDPRVPTFLGPGFRNECVVEHAIRFDSEAEAKEHMKSFEGTPCFLLSGVMEV